MNNFLFVREIAIALKLELIKYRYFFVFTAILILLIVLLIGLVWKNTYVSGSIIEINYGNAIQPARETSVTSLKGVDQIDEAQRILFSSDFMIIVAKVLGYTDDNINPEDLPDVIERLSSGLSGGLDSERPNLLNIEYQTTDPDTAYLLANTFSEELVNYQQASQTEISEQNYQYFAEQAKLYRERMEAAEIALLEFRSSSLDVSESVVQSRISELESDIQNLKLAIQSNRSSVSDIKDEIRSKNNYRDVLSDLYLLNQQKSTLNSELTQLRAQFQDSYPDIVSIKLQISEVDKKLISIRNNELVPKHIISFSDAEGLHPNVMLDKLQGELSEKEDKIKSQLRTLASLQDVLENERKKAEVIIENQSKVTDLTDVFAVNKSLYEEFLKKEQDASMAVALLEEDRSQYYNVLKAPSYPTEAIGLTQEHLFLVAPVLAIAFPLVVFLALILLDPRMRRPSKLRSVISSEIEFLGALEHYNTALSKKVISKDFLILALLTVFAFALYTFVLINASVVANLIPEVLQKAIPLRF